MKQFKLFLQLTFIFILIISCSSEDEPQEVKITVSTEDIAFTINENHLFCEPGQNLFYVFSF